MLIKSNSWFFISWRLRFLSFLTYKFFQSLIVKKFDKMRVITKARMKELSESKKHSGGTSKTIKKEGKQHTRVKKFDKIVFEYLEDTIQTDQVRNLWIKMLNWQQRWNKKAQNLFLFLPQMFQSKLTNKISYFSACFYCSAGAQRLPTQPTSNRGQSRGRGKAKESSCLPSTIGQSRGVGVETFRRRPTTRPSFLRVSLWSQCEDII